MLNIDEILKGIGQQMARSVPSWTGASPVQAPAPLTGGNAPLFGGLQNSGLGSFGSYLQGGLQQGPAAPTFGLQQSESAPTFGLQQGSSDPVFGLQQGAPYGGLWSQQAQAQKNAMNVLNSVNAKTAAPTAPGADTSVSSDAGDMEAYIRHSAAVHGINPDTAVAVAKSEGLNTYNGDSGSSFGPYQLHYGGVAGGGNSVSGLGDTFTKETGLDARDAKTAHQQVDWVMQGLSSGRFDWTPWHGAAGIGVTGKQGIGGTYQDPGYAAHVAPTTQTLSPADVGAPQQDTHGGRVTQYDPQLSAAEQLAACGPTAAAAIAGISPRQALDTAKQLGLWDQANGMHGPQAEVALLNRLGINAHAEAVDWGKVNASASPKTPVLVDTPGHYFYIDGADGRGNYHVGTSGTDLKHGAEWMTPSQMAALMGAPRSLIFGG